MPKYGCFLIFLQIYLATVLGSGVDRSEHAPHQAHPGGIPGVFSARPALRRSSPRRRLQDPAQQPHPARRRRPPVLPARARRLRTRNLLNWYAEYVAQPDVYHPPVVVAWLHHRFTQIHPFQDGNGRVTRALVTWHLVQYEYRPIVVTRDDRNDYNDALEADDVDLSTLVAFTDRLHQRSVLQALST